MSYMILDVMLFVGLFLVIYFAFTFPTIYIYNIYEEFNQDSNFVDNKKAFKYFFWALIRTGNPEFADIKIPVYKNSSSHEENGYTQYNASCLKKMLNSNLDRSWLMSDNIDRCLMKTKPLAQSDVFSSAGMPNGEAYELENDDGVIFVIGNVLWATYQFILVIVLLSVLRAKMINTYQNIIREADIQWKFFRYVSCPLI